MTGWAQRLRCIFGFHQRDRRKVWYDKVDFRSTCTGCGTPLVRDPNDGWRRFDPKVDGRVDRSPNEAGGTRRR